MLAQHCAKRYREARSKGARNIRASVLHHVLCFTLLLAASTVGMAQQSANAWQGIESLKAGTSIRITLTKEKILCAFDSADENALICHKRQAGVDRSISLPKNEVLLIRARNATGSVVAGTLIGIGVGAGTGAIVDSTIKDSNTTNNAKFTRGLAPIAGLLGALFGVATDFVPGKLLYKGESQHP
jgi:hypothetical protein